MFETIISKLIAKPQTTAAPISAPVASKKARKPSLSRQYRAEVIALYKWASEFYYARAESLEYLNPDASDRAFANAEFYSRELQGVAIIPARQFNAWFAQNRDGLECLWGWMCDKCGVSSTAEGLAQFGL